MNIFERAARAKLRYETTVGALSVEQLFDLPLTAARSGRIDLDGIARGIARELKEIDGESFVDERPNPRKDELELSLEIVKHVIASKIADKKAAETRAANAERRRKLMAALDAKEDSELAGMTREQIQEEIAKTEAA